MLVLVVVCVRVCVCVCVCACWFTVLVRFLIKFSEIRLYLAVIIKSTVDNRTLFYGVTCSESLSVDTLLIIHMRALCHRGKVYLTCESS